MIYEEITAGRLIARKVGRRTVVRRSDALRWLRLLPSLGTHDQSNEAPTMKMLARHRKLMGLLLRVN
jgi:hypothetical protein